MLPSSAFRVLNCFFGKDSLSIAQICKQAEYPVDLATHYVNQLTADGYLTKTDHAYSLSPEGLRQLTLRFSKPEHYLAPRLITLVVTSRADKYVIMRRTALPFIGAAEWPACSTNVGESVATSARRALHERLNISGQPTFVGFFRRTDTYKGEFFDDKLFAVHTYKLNLDDVIAASTATGDNFLCTERELAELPRPSKALFDIFHYARDSKRSLEERSYELEAADFSLPAHKS